MTNDALDPGERGDYPHFPRHADGSPAWSDSPDTDGVPVIGPDGIARAPMPRGIRYQLIRGERIMLNVTPTGPGGVPIDPPVIP
jgi:hypothetical protein